MTAPSDSTLRIDHDAPLGEQLATIIEQLPEDHLTLRELLHTFGDEGLLLLTVLLTLVFLIPVSIPGVSTVFGAAILLVGVSRLLGRPLWLPQRLQDRALPAERLRPGLQAGMKWVGRMERISRPRRLPAPGDHQRVRHQQPRGERGRSFDVAVHHPVRHHRLLAAQLYPVAVAATRH